MAYTPTGGPATSTPNPQAPATAVQPTTRSKTLAPEPDSKLSSNSRDTVSYLESATDTKLNQDELQTWLAVDLEHPNFCIFDRLLNHMLSLRVPDGLTIDNDILLDKCLKDVLPICHLEEVINCIKAYCAEVPNTGRSRYVPNDPSLDNVAARAVDGVYYGMLNEWGLAPTIGLSWHASIERTGTLSFRGIDVCHADSWASLITRLYRHELEGDIWVLPWAHLQYDEKNVMRSHPGLESWTGALAAARDAKIAMHSKWDDYAPLAGWESEWPLAYSLCEMHYDAHHARNLVRRYHKEDPDHYPSLEDTELSTEAVYEQFWAKVKRFYKVRRAEEAYKVLREELCLPVDL